MIEIILSMGLIATGALVAWVFWPRNNPVEDLLKRRAYLDQGVLHIKGQLTPDEAKEIRDAWERQYPFRRRAF